ncbi:hypothetical protein ES706_05776 [subsurface metagenome]
MKKSPSIIKVLLIGSNYEKSIQFLHTYGFKLTEGEYDNGDTKRFLEYKKSLRYNNISLIIKIWIINTFSNILEMHDLIQEINSLLLIFDIHDIDSFKFLKKEDFNEIINVFEFSESIIMVGINYGNSTGIQIDRDQIIKKSSNLNILYCFEVDLKNFDDLYEIFNKIIKDYIFKMKLTSPKLFEKTKTHENLVDFIKPEEKPTETIITLTHGSGTSRVLNLENAYSEMQKDIKNDLKIREEIIELTEQIKEEKIINKIIKKPMEILIIKKPKGRRKCPICYNANKAMIHESEDKDKVLLAYPRIYGRKFRCGFCKTEWREEY